MRQTLAPLFIGAAILLAAGCAQSTPTVKTAESGQDLTHEATLASAKSGPAAGKTAGDIEAVTLFYGPMPTGVAVSRTGRTFVCYPRWGEPVDYTVAEIKNGRAVPYPDRDMNQLNTRQPTDNFVSVQSVVIDPQDRLWILDTGSINFEPTIPRAPKLVCVDLTQDKIVKRIDFSPAVALSTTYLNDVRFDMTHGSEGTAYITDSSTDGPNAIIVVDLGSGQSWRKLEGDPSVTAQSNFVPIVEGQPLLNRPPGGTESYLHFGADGIAISNDGRTLYYCPLASRHLYSIPTDALADRNLPPAKVSAAVHDLGVRDYASDGLASDAQGRLYLTDYEHNAIHRRSPDGRDEIIAQDSRMIWPDSMAVGPNGYLYFTCNQVNRMPRFHHGEDLRKQPYVLFRTKADAQPITLTSESNRPPGQ